MTLQLTHVVYKNSTSKMLKILCANGLQYRRLVSQSSLAHHTGDRSSCTSNLCLQPKNNYYLGLGLHKNTELYLSPQSIQTRLQLRFLQSAGVQCVLLSRSPPRTEATAYTVLNPPSTTWCTILRKRNYQQSQKHTL